MRVLYVHQLFATLDGSVGTRSYQLARELVRMGHEVEILTGPTHLTDEDLPQPRKLVQSFEVDRINVTCINVQYQHKMSYRRRIWAFLKWLAVACLTTLQHRRADVIIVSSPPLTVGVIGFLNRTLRRIPFVFEMVDAHLEAAIAFGIIRNKSLIRILRKCEAQCFHQAAAVIAEHEAVGQFMTRRIKTRTPVETVYYPSDMDVYSPNPDPKRFRRQWQVEDKVVAVHTGSMGRINGLDMLVEAADRLKQSHPQLEILAIGGGVNKERLEEMVKQRQLPNMRILPYVVKKDMPDVLAAADIGIMSVAPIPIMEYCTPNKVSDYCAMGLPVIANYGGWLGKMLEENRAGLWSPQGDLDGFVRNLGTLAEDADLRKEMGENAERLAGDMFDRIKMARRLEAILYQAVGKRDKALP